MALLRANPALRLSSTIQRALLWDRPIGAGSPLATVGWGQFNPDILDGPRFLKAVRTGKTGLLTTFSVKGYL